MQACLTAASNFVHADTCLAAIGNGDIAVHGIAFACGVAALAIAAKLLG